MFALSNSLTIANGQMWVQQNAMARYYISRCWKDILETVRCAVMNADEPGNEVKAPCKSDRWQNSIVIGRSGLCW